MPMCISVVLMAQQQASGINAVLTYSEDILSAAGMSNSQIGTVIVGGMNVIGTVLSVLVVDRLGRKVLLCTSAIGMVACLVTLGVAFYLDASKNPHCNATP